MEMCPQGYLEDTVYGHDAGEAEPAELLANEVLLELDRHDGAVGGR